MMVLVASAQALLFNFTERGWDLARAGLDALEWADTFLQKGTLCLTFLGASLATFQDNHIAIEVVPKLLGGSRASLLKAVASLAAGGVALVLATVYFEACLVADAAVPFQYELLTDQGPTHVCDASQVQVPSLDRPDVLCLLRAGLGALGIPVSSGGGIAQLVVPLALVVIGVRLLGRALVLTLRPCESDSPRGAPS